MRIMIADDSAVVRTIITQGFAKNPGPFIGKDKTLVDWLNQVCRNLRPAVNKLFNSAAKEVLPRPEISKRILEMVKR